MPPLTIAAVGDIMLGDSPQVFGYGVASAVRRHGADHLFDAVRDRLRRADLAVANLEVVLATVPSGSRFSDRLYRGDPSSAAALKRAGIGVVTVCTNHTMQHGDSAFDEFVTCLQQAEILVAGADRPALSLHRIVECERQNARIAILSYNFRPVQYSAAEPAWPSPDEQLLRSDIAQVRARADVVMVTLHWGDEFIPYPSPWQVRTARLLVDSGADIVIGHHPHIVQGVEQYRGGVIAYSLGNFVFDQWQDRLRRSMILHLQVNGPGEVTYQIEPVMIDGGYRPVPCTGRALDEEIAHHRRLAEAIGKQDEVQYQHDLAKKYTEFRREIVRHYLTKAWKFKPSDLLSNVGEMIRRRVQTT